MESTEFSTFLNSSMNSKIISLGYWTCYFINIPGNSSNKDLISPKDGDETLYRCYFRTKYLLGERLGAGVCVTLCVLISLIGVFGVVSNVVNILVLRHTTKGASLQKLLVILAGFDGIASCFGALTAVLVQIIIDEVSRDGGTLVALKTCYVLYSFGRTGSIFMTILITVERYFVVAYHIRAKDWLNSRGPLIVTSIWLLLIVLINLPCLLNADVIPGPQNSTDLVSTRLLSKYPYFFVSTKFSKEIYYATWFRVIHDFIDYAMPLPVLLFFNGMLYKFIYDWNKRRQSLTVSHVREVNAAKMFSIVALTLFSCHTFNIIDFMVTEATNNVYRELLLITIMAVGLNASVNSFVYYAFGKDYRERFRLLVGVGSKIGREKGDPSTRRESLFSSSVGGARTRTRIEMTQILTKT